MSQPTDVSDVRSNAPEHIDHAVQVIGRSRQRLKVFEAIYRGKKRIKTLKELEGALSTTSSKNISVRLLQEGGILSGNQIVEQVKVGRPLRTAYKKIPFYSKNYKKIIDLVKHPKKAKSFPTKRKIKVQVQRTGFYRFISKPQAVRLYIDDLDSFEKVRKAENIHYAKIHSIPERTINRGICRILNNGEKNDWGGERNDIFGSVKLKGKRKTAAFALKGKGTKGILTLNKMGHKGDQVQRLFESSAEIHILVYHDSIDERVQDQMQIMAINKSVASGNKKIYFCIVDGTDLERLLVVYSKEFGL